MLSLVVLRLAGLKSAKSFDGGIRSIGWRALSPPAYTAVPLRALGLRAYCAHVYDDGEANPFVALQLCAMWARRYAH